MIFGVLIGQITNNLHLSPHQVENTIKLIDDGATIPFISRYRKEVTGGLNEVQIGDLAAEYERLKQLKKRKETIFSTIEEQGKLSDELRQKIDETWDLAELEDLYLPYKPKRRTRAQMAIEKGLEPLAKIIMSQRSDDIEGLAFRFVKGEVENVDDAVAGALDIIAEWISESSSARQAMRFLFEKTAIISSKVIKGKEEDGEKYTDYFDKSLPLRRVASHQLLAMRRGEAEKILRVDISPDEEQCLERLERVFVKSKNEGGELVEKAVKDAFKRLLKPSIETEFGAKSKEKADTEAIRIFADNLRQLLLASPLGQKRVLALDPGFRTGCKVVCLDAQGNLLYNDTIYPHPPKNERTKAAAKIAHLVEQYKIEAIAIGNGTAGRETEQFIQNIRYDRKMLVFSVSESGASIYSASKLGREEFPDYDVTVRGAVSIGRRLMDPLAELVKIDPKSIGVGQYQYDVDQTRLKSALDQTVLNCVNLVGVDVNVASPSLLQYVSGLGPQLAQNIVTYRAENGAFDSRKSLLKVPKMGAKTYEQCAGFLRIADAENPLDNSAVHPERYALVQQMADDVDCTVKQLIENQDSRKKIVLEKYVSDEVGLPTLKDILLELEKPGRDPRTAIEAFEFDPNIRNIEDLIPGMVVNGIVTNITAFGAFVDIGVHENGLIHISQMADRRISSPSEVVKLHQYVKVKVLEVDVQRKRIGLSLKV